MTIKSTSFSLTTTPTLIAGGAGALVDLTRADVDDPVELILQNDLTNKCYIKGDASALGAAPAFISLSTVAGSASAIQLSLTASDPLFAATTVAGGVLFILATRQQTA